MTNDQLKKMKSLLHRLDILTNVEQGGHGYKCEEFDHVYEYVVPDQNDEDEHQTRAKTRFVGSLGYLLYFNREFGAPALSKIPRGRRGLKEIELIQRKMEQLEAEITGKDFNWLELYE